MGGSAKEPQLLVERRVRFADPGSAERIPVKGEFSIRIWRLPRGTPSGVPSWMSSFRVDNDLNGIPVSSHILGNDDFEAMALSLASATNLTTRLERAGFELWFSQDPEYPLKSSEARVIFSNPRAR